MKLDRVIINDVVRTESIRLADILNILETGVMPEQVYVDDLIVYIKHKMELLESKKSNSSSSKEKEAVRTAIREAVLNVLQAEPDRWFTVSEIIASDTEKLGMNYSNSAVTYVLTKLKEEGLVMNSKDKKKSLYTIGK